MLSRLQKVLLAELKVKRIIITGISGNNCVLFTAFDAHMREYEVVVPRDGVASKNQKENNLALAQLKSVLKIRTPLSSSV